MCGRFSQAKNLEDLYDEFPFIDEPFDDILQPRYNIAPSQLSPVIVHENGSNKLKMYKWVEYYNMNYLHSAIGYRTPIQAEEWYYNNHASHENAA